MRRALDGQPPRCGKPGHVLGQQGHIRRLQRHFAAGDPHGDAHVRACKSSGIVDAIPHEGCPPPGCQRPDQRNLVAGQKIGMDLAFGKAQILADAQGHRAAVAGHQGQFGHARPRNCAKPSEELDPAGRRR